MARQTKIYGLTEMILIGPFPGIHKHSVLSHISIKEGQKKPCILWCVGNWFPCSKLEFSFTDFKIWLI